MRHTSVAVLSLAVVLFAAGCGGDDGAQGEQQPPPAATTEGETATDGEALSGEGIFRQNCAGCHTLEAAGTTGSVGPNLDQRAPSADEVEEQVREGGGGMPSFAGRLSDPEIAAVAQYVAESARE